ncbi:MAG TPA: hypothetical protein VN628_12785, partial [Vicinamibacterales bacterium]|nr:hypothetical protein [Vicinamibacterales bacterium]
VAFGMTSSARTWAQVLDRLSTYGAKIVVPAHGDYGTGAMIDEQKEAFAFLRKRVNELKAMNTSADDAVKIITAEFAKAHPAWMNANRSGNIVRGMYAE